MNKRGKHIDNLIVYDVSKNDKGVLIKLSFVKYDLFLFCHYSSSCLELHLKIDH